METTIPKYDTTDIKITPKEIEVAITDIRVVEAKTVYGEAVINPDQELFLIVLENKEYDVKTEQTIPKYDKGNVPDNSKLGSFLSKYGKFEVGMTIKLSKNHDGYWRINI